MMRMLVAVMRHIDYVPARDQERHNNPCTYSTPLSWAQMTGA